MRCSKGEHGSMESRGILRRASWLFSEDLCSYKGQAEKDPNQKWGQKKASAGKKIGQDKKSKNWDHDSGKSLQKGHLKLKSE